MWARRSKHGCLPAGKPSRTPARIRRAHDSSYPRVRPSAARRRRGPQPRPVVEQTSDGSDKRRRIGFRHEQPRAAILDDRGDAAGRRGYQRRCRRQRLHHDVGQAVHVAGGVAHRRHDHDIGGCETGGDFVLVQNAWQDCTRAERVTGDARVELAPQVAVAGQHQTKARMPGRQFGDGVDEVLESLLAHEAADGEHHLRVVVQAPVLTQPAARLRIGFEARGVDAVRHGGRTIGRGAEREGPLPQVVAARRDEACAAECPSRCPPDDAVPLGHEDVRAVEADDQRPRPGRRRSDDTAGHDPVPVDDRRVDPVRQRRGRAPCRGHRQRCGRHGGATQALVGLERPGIAEDVHRPAGRVLEQMEPYPAVAVAALPARMPGEHQVNLVSPRGQPGGNGLHEGAHGVTGKPGIGRGDHHHALAGGHGRENR